MLGIDIFWIQLIIVMFFIVIGMRLGGVGLGAMGALGVLVLVFLFGSAPAAPPIAVMLTILSVVTAASTLQACGGLDYMVYLAEKLLRKKPSMITFMAPVVTFFFTVFSGTAHVTYSVLPVIAEVSRETGIRPERPMSVSVIASMQAITASPLSPGTIALLTLLPTFSVLQILSVTLPATFIGCMVAALVVSKKGLELNEDPEYLKRLDAGLIPPLEMNQQTDPKKGAKLACLLFLMAALTVVTFGSIEAIRPTWEVVGADGTKTEVMMDMSTMIQLLMLSFSAIMMLTCKPVIADIVSGSVFKAGAAAVVAIFGVVWMGDTLFQGNIDYITGGISEIVTAYPLLFALALFVLSTLLYSQAATIKALGPLGLTLGVSPELLVGIFPAVNGYFFIPNYPTLVAAMNFDRTGTTKVGKYVLNHSFMVPGIVATAVAVTVGAILSSFIL